MWPRSCLFPHKARLSLPFPRLLASKEPSQVTPEQTATEGQNSNGKREPQKCQKVR